MNIFIMQNGLISLGAMLAGLIVDTSIGIQKAIGGMAFILILPAIVSLITLRRIRVLV